MTRKPNSLTARWSKRERDILYDWGEGVSRSDGHLLNTWLTYVRGLEGLTLIEELKARGFDIATLRFSIEKVNGEKQ